MSGTVLAVGLIGATAVLTSLALPLYTVLVERSAVTGAADAAAIAAADTAVGIHSGVACDQAALVARANAAELRSCEVDGLVVTVSVSRPVLGFDVVAVATAGPPGAPPD